MRFVRAATKTFARKALPRRGFAKGLILAIVLVMPATGGAAYLLSQLGVAGDAGAPFARVIAFAAVFAGLPALVTCGGIGRLAAQAVRLAEGPTMRPAIRAALPPFAFAGAGFVILTIVPLGALPEGWPGWSMTVAIGAVAGAVSSVVLGAWVGGNRPAG